MLQPGTQVGRYEIQRRLGRGGMGAVYVAHDPVLGRMVAIKVFAGELDMPDARERFVREARSAAALTHANIVTVYDFGELPSEPYIVMEYVQGETLAQVIRRKAPIAVADKLRWMEELCAGVGYAHQNSVLHRDIKPANLMIDRSGRLRILDFGIARLMGTASTTTAVIGTPGYMAPEQIEGGAVDQRADLFSVGAVIYELLTYTEAFPGKTAPAITHRIMTADPVPMAHAAPDVSPELAAIVEQALKKDPADRPPNAEAVRRAINGCRRQAESTAATGEATGAPTLILPRTPGTGERPATGPADAAAATPTPAPDQRRTDREALARRRTAQVQAALDLARTRFAQNDLDAALEACEQALTLDETHQAALELEWNIQAALLARTAAAAAADDAPDGGTMLAPPRALGAAGEPPRPLRDQDTPASPPSEPPAATNWEATVVMPPQRTPQPGPLSRPAGMEAAETVIARPAPKTSTRSPIAGARDGWSALKGRAGTLPPKAWIAAAATVGVVALAVAVLMMVGGGSSTGALVIDAVPWAMVTAVDDENGQPQVLPPDASTPLLLNVPAGRYVVSVVGPPPASEARRLSVVVEPGAVTTPPAELFRAITAEEYFDPYLSRLVASADTPQ